MSLYLRRRPKFEYLAPHTIREACSMANQYRGDSKFLAGGTDLLVQMKNRQEIPKVMISLKNISELDFIKYDKANGLRIGALTTLQSIVNSQMIKEKYNILYEATNHMASLQIRNLGTIVGNICNGAPSADTVPSLLVLNAKLKLFTMEGEQVVPIEDFFRGPFQTILSATAILTEIMMDTPPPLSSSTYIKHTLRNAMDLARVGVAAFIQSSSAKNGECEDARIALGACAPIPMRARKAEEILRGHPLSDENVQKASQAASDESDPRVDSFRTPFEYRKEMIKVLTNKAIKKICII